MSNGRRRRLNRSAMPAWFLRALQIFPLFSFSTKGAHYRAPRPLGHGVVSSAADANLLCCSPKSAVAVTALCAWHARAENVSCIKKLPGRTLDRCIQCAGSTNHCPTTSCWRMQASVLNATASLAAHLTVVSSSWSPHIHKILSLSNPVRWKVVHKPRLLGSYAPRSTWKAGYRCRMPPSDSFRNASLLGTNHGPGKKPH